jgi:penicillin-binding protein 1A
VRKIKEMILAWRIERYLTKHEILYLYLNQIYLGHGAYGVEAAATTYFGKHTKDLDTAEAALLAGLVQAPSRYSPLRYPRRARARQVYVLERLVADKKITPGEAEAALGEQLSLRPHRPETVPANYYEETVRQWLEDRFGATALYEGGLTVITACDGEQTRQALAAMESGLDQLTRRHGFQGPVGHVSPEELSQAAARPLPEATALEQGQVYTGLITALSPQTQSLVLRVGADQGRVGLADLQQWRSGLTNVGQSTLKPGDQVRVRAAAYDAKSKAWSFNLVQEPVAQAATIVLENGNGRVRVLIGGRNFHQSQYNRAMQARRSPGSSFKPFIYAAALDRPENPYTPSSILIDAPVVYDDPSQPDDKWRPKNYDGHFNGPTTFRQSLEQSRNVPTVKLLEDIGVKYTVGYARRFGIESELTPTLSLALGASGVSLLELTRAYSVFVNQGLLMEPVLIERVLDREGRVIYSAQPEKRQAISPQVAFVMTNLLKGVVDSGTGRGLQIPGRALAGKTGTTNDLRDAWFIGFSPQLTCGVWVGRDDNEPLGSKETGGRAAGPIWKEFMQKALANLPPADFTPPEGVVFARVDKDTGQASAGGFFEAFKEGTQPGSGAQTAGSWAQHPSSADLPGPARTQDFLEDEAFRRPGLE